MFTFLLAGLWLQWKYYKMINKGAQFNTSSLSYYLLRNCEQSSEVTLFAFCGLIRCVINKWWVKQMFKLVSLKMQCINISRLAFTSPPCLPITSVQLWNNSNAPEPQLVTRHWIFIIFLLEAQLPAEKNTANLPGEKWHLSDTENTAISSLSSASTLLWELGSVMQPCSAFASPPWWSCLDSHYRGCDSFCMKLNWKLQSRCQ